MTTFNLCDEPWIEVRYASGDTRLVSLHTAFSEADQIATIGGELPTQAVAILRLMLAILIRATRAQVADGLSAWMRWWRQGLPLAEVESYLDAWKHRFDLRDPTVPFLQVATLATASGRRSGLGKLIADVPDGHPFFTTRAGSGRECIEAAEAARWIVHCQSFDPSGIKSGAVGDERVRGGKGYPIGIAWAGWLGVVLLEGANLCETLLLNLSLFAPDPADDLPVWERDPLGATVEVDHTAPLGTADLYTWPSRRVLLIWQDDLVVDTQISNGDPLSPQNLNQLEPMTSWRRSPTQEKKLGLSTVYMPQAHSPSRQVWRGLAGLLDPKPETARENSTHLRSGTLEWLNWLRDDGVIPPNRLIRLRTVGMAYGSQSAVIETVVDDAMEARVAALTEPVVIALALRGVAHADGAVQALADLAGNLADATNSDRDAARQKAREQGYAALDPHYRNWFATLSTDSDVELALAEWSRTVGTEISHEGEFLVSSAGPGALKGRNTARPGEKSRHMDVGRAWLYFRRKLLASLSLPNETTHETEEPR